MGSDYLPTVPGLGYRSSTMYCIVVGVGEVGRHVAEILSKEGHEVAVVERDPERLRTVVDDYDVRGIQGNGAALRTLYEANIGQARILIAVTDSDEVNMIACMTAKRAGVPLTIARVRNPDYLDSDHGVASEFTGIDRVIQPEKAVAEEIGRLAEYTGAVEVESFANGQVIMLEIRVNPASEAAGKTVAAIGLPRGVLITGLLRGREVNMPRGDTVLEAGDSVFVVGRPDSVRAAASLLSGKRDTTRSAILLGCGVIGLGIAEELERRGLRLKVFEKDKAKAEQAACTLARSLVLHDSGLSENVLLNEGIREVDMFVAATGDDRLNMLAALQAKRLGAERTMAVVEESQFSGILETLGVDVAVSPRRLAASAVLRLIRTGEVVNSALLDKSAGEVLELLVTEKSRIAGVPLKEARFPRGAVLGVLVRGEQVIMARGDSVPAPGDLAIVFSATESVPEVERLFAAR